MKGKSFLSGMIITSCMLFSSTVSAADLSVKRTDTPVTIDGMAADAAWAQVEENMVAHPFVGVPDGPADSEGNFKMLWDDTYLYFICVVTDEILIEDTEGANEHDESFDLFFDTAYDGGNVPNVDDDYLLTLEWSSSGTCLMSGEKGVNLFAIFDTTGTVAKCTETSDGYIIEAAIPLEKLGLVGGNTFGFDLRINDDDDGGSRDTQIAWYADDVNNWNKPSAIAAVELVNETISEITNFSFELPGTVKIKGWDGECADAGYTGPFVDIAGWTSDKKPFDSGVETGWGPTDGLWTAAVMAVDSSVYQLTGHVIAEGEKITLLVDARNTWSESGKATLLMTLFYDDNGIQAPVASGQYELTDNMMEYSVSFKAANKPESIGHRLGIAFDNVNTADRSWMGLDNVRLATTTGVSDRRTNPNAFSLEQNYPNPYNPSTTIIYTLNSNGKVHLSVYDLLGKEVSVLVNGVQTQGKHEVIFSGNSLSNGVYFYRLQTDKEVITKKMTLMK